MRLRNSILVALCALTLSLTACGSDGTDPVDVLTVRLVAPTVEQAQYINTDVLFRASAQLEDGGELDPDATIVFDFAFGDGGQSQNVRADVRHAYATSSTYTVDVTARALVDEKTVAEGEGSFIVNVFDPANLVMTGASLITEGNVGPNDTFRATADLENNEAAARTDFDVAFFLTDEGIDTQAPMTAALFESSLAGGLLIEIARESVSAIFPGPNGTQLFDLQTLSPPANLSSGRYGLLVYADPDDTVGETDEDDNFVFAAEPLLYEGNASGPDLFWSQVLVQPELTNQLDQLQFRAVIENSGTETATLFDYAIYLSEDDTTLDDGDLEVRRGQIDAIAAGDSVELPFDSIQISPAITDVGTYYFIAVVDEENTVQEAADTNNTAVSNAVVVTSEVVPGADITPTSMIVTPETTFLGGSVQVDVVVENIGNQAADRQTLCRFYASEDAQLDTNGTDERLGSEPVPPLDPGELYAFQFDAPIPEFIAPGEYTPFLLCDATFLVQERIEGNNSIAGSPFTIAGTASVDLGAEAFEISPLVVENEETVSVSVDVCNRGSNGSSPSIVRVYLSEDPSLDRTDTVLIESRVPPVDAEACVTIRADVPAVCDTFVADYHVFAVVDDTDLVTEVNEDNNETELDDQLRINGLICNCELDRFEANDTPAAARFLNPAVGTYEQLTMCNSNVDYYKIPLLDAQTVRVETRFDDDRGNLDMQLFSLDFSTVLDSSETDGDIEEVSFVRVPRNGDYLLRVRGRSDDDRNVYDLTLTVSSPEEGVDLTVLDVQVDELRPVLGAEVEVCFDVVNLGDTGAPATLSRLYLSDDTRVDPVDDVLIGELAIEAFEGRVSRCVDVVLPDELGGGDKYIGVVADARNDVADELNETNNSGLSPQLVIDASCFDVLEPNNTLEEPRLLTFETEPPVLLTDLLACSDNRDFYEICLSDGDFLDVDVNFDSLQGDIDIKLYNEEGVQLARSESTGDQESVSVDYAAGDQCYRVEVYVAGRDREIPYTITVDTGRAPDELICSRVEEPNDGFGTAARLRDFLDTCMAVCPTEDEDYYFLNLSPGTELEVRLEPIDGEEDVPSDLRLTLWGPSRNFLTNTISAVEPLTQRIALNGRHYIRVRSNGDGERDQPYCLVVEGLSGVDLVPSEFAPEDDIAAPGDTVRFSFTLANTRDQASPETTYAVYLSDDPVLSRDTDLLLRTVEIDAIDALTSRLEGRRFDVPLTLGAGGQYYVILSVDDADEVEEFSESNNIIVSPLFVSARCIPDEAEPNNFPGDAFAITETLELTSCGVNDDDWFTFVADRPRSEVTVRFEDALGDVNVFVYTDPFAAPFVFSDSITDDELLEFETEIGTTYWVRVSQYTDQSTEYRLIVD